MCHMWKPLNDVYCTFTETKILKAKKCIFILVLVQLWPNYRCCLVVCCLLFTVVWTISLVYVSTRQKWKNKSQLKLNSLPACTSRLLQQLFFSSAPVAVRLPSPHILLFLSLVCRTTDEELTSCSALRFVLVLGVTFDAGHATCCGAATAVCLQLRGHYVHTVWHCICI